MLGVLGVLRVLLLRLGVSVVVSVVMVVGVVVVLGVRVRVAVVRVRVGERRVFVQRAVGVHHAKVLLRLRRGQRRVRVAGVGQRRLARVAAYRHGDWGRGHGGGWRGWRLLRVVMGVVQAQLPLQIVV